VNLCHSERNARKELGRKLYRFILTFSILIILLSGCSSDKGYLKIVNKKGDKNIIHTVKAKNGVVVFYIPDNMNNSPDEEYSSLSASFIKKTIFGWKETLDRGGHSLSGKQELTSQYLYKSDDKSPFPMLYGVINNPKIKNIRIIILQNNTPIKGKIINNKEQRIWYSFLNQPNKVTKFEIQGLTDDGEILTSIFNDDLLLSNNNIGTKNN
jgi:hypothetical protein